MGKTREFNYEILWKKQDQVPLESLDISSHIPMLDKRRKWSGGLSICYENQSVN